MVLSPIKVLSASALAVSSLGIVIIKTVSSNKSDTKSAENDFELIPVTSLSKDDSQEGTYKGCHIYLVEKSQGGEEGSQIDREYRRRGNVSKIFKRFKRPHDFLRGLRSTQSKFVEDVEKNGCKGGIKGIFVYQDGQNWVYSSDLQRKDWLQNLEVIEKE